MQLILASGSERRKELISWLGVQYKIVVSDFNEGSVYERNPEKLVERLALEKAKWVVSRIQPSIHNTASRRRLIQPFREPVVTEGDTRDGRSESRASKFLVIGADTVVEIDHEIIGKPKDVKDARRILRKLSGKTHTVYTGLAVLDISSGKKVRATEKTQVTFRKLSDKEIADYVATGEPLDKGGGYAIQLGAKGFVTKVEGSYTNVVGLPLPALARLLNTQGFRIKKDVSNIVFEKTGYRS